MPNQRGWERFLPGGLFLLAMALMWAWAWQPAAAHDGGRRVEAEARPQSFSATTGGGVTLTVWVREIMTTVAAGIDFRSDALQFDQAGRPVLVFVMEAGTPPTPTVYLARQEGATWQIEEAGRGAEAEPSLAIDAEDRPHSSWVQDGVVYHAQRDGGAWTIAAIDHGKGAAAAAAIAADGAGTIGVAFTVRVTEPPALYHARPAGGGWSVETAITGTQEGNPGSVFTIWFTGPIDLSYDSKGRPYAAYTNAVTGRPRAIEHLEYAAKIDGAWRQYFAAGDMMVTGHALQVADALGGYVAYSTFGPPCVIPCSRTSTTTVTAIGDDGSAKGNIYRRSDSDLEALAVHDGKPAILYLRYSSTGKELWYDRIKPGGVEPGSIESTPIATEDFGSAALAFNRRGEPLIVYYAPERGQLVAMRTVQVAFPYGLHLPLISVSR
jgi:hypothetical protein